MTTSRWSKTFRNCGYVWTKRVNSVTFMISVCTRVGGPDWVLKTNSEPSNVFYGDSIEPVKNFVAKCIKRNLESDKLMKFVCQCEGRQQYRDWISVSNPSLFRWNKQIKGVEHFIVLHYDNKYHVQRQGKTPQDGYDTLGKFSTLQNALKLTDSIEAA